MDQVVATLRVGVLTLDCMCAVTPQVASSQTACVSVNLGESQPASGI
jgi:hypothetical protein